MTAAWWRKPPAREAADETQKRPRVLVVDDDAGIRRALARLFARLGLDVIAVATGAEALAALTDRSPDLVVLDLGLPDVDGFALCEQIRARGELPIIVLTGRSDDEALARAFDAGASDFASKAEPLAALAQRARFLLRARGTLAALLASEARLQEAQRLAQLASFRYELATRTLAGDAELWRLLGTARGVLPKLAPAESASLAASVRECLENARVVSGELRARGDDGVERALRYRMQLALDEQGDAVALAGVVQDVSEWRRSEARALFLAEHDPATRLPNRAGFVARLGAALAEARANATGVGVITIGLDAVERVAETLGRAAADALLAEAATRIAEAVGVAGRELARSGATQFALLAPAGGNAGTAELTALARRALDAFEAPLRLRSHELMLSASAGLALFPNDGADAESVLRSAERALASARSGASRIALHSAATSADAFRRFTLASRLRGALERGELVLYYQPKLSLASGEILGFEGLVRWQEPELGLLPPAEFIPLAEESGLIIPLGDWVMREACRQSVAWQRAGLGEVPIAVNLSAKHFRREGVAERVAQILRETGASPRQLGIEITESVLLEDADAAIRELVALRALGIELALDDFGTGFSSLSYLRTLPVQTVKIDRAFISEIATREDAAALTASIVAMAKALWLRVVAEGVERDAERALVSIWGCEEAQGFLFSHPVPASEAEQLWRTRGPGSAAVAPKE